MKAGADVIVQAAVGNERWYGRPDVLTKVARPSAFGGWSYEVVDTKLSRETKAGSVLQLALYCHLLEAVQGTRPERFHVVTPDGTETYRVDDYAAYFRFVRAGLDEATGEDDEALAAANYPEPVDLCDVCVWAARCAQRRRKDDHLSLVAGISRTQRRELTERGVPTLTALASMPIRPMTFRPKRGAAESYERVREQARVQLEARSKGPVFELLPVAEGEGLSRLPEPTPGDMFLDLEGDPFAGRRAELRGREYLFGLVTLKDDGTPVYTAFWAETPEKEKAAFEAVMDRIALARQQHPGMHVFHYSPYEPSAFKRLMGRHATRQEDMDVLLRSRDLRRPLRRRAAGPSGRRRALLDQEPRAVLRVQTRRRPAGRAPQPDGDGAGGRGEQGRRAEARSSRRRGGLQPRRLRLDAPAARLARDAQGCRVRRPAEARGRRGAGRHSASPAGGGRGVRGTHGMATAHRGTTRAAAPG